MIPMGYILLAAAAQFINAIVAIIDKYIVTDEGALPRPFVYAFYTCLITGSWILVFMAGFLPGLSTLGIPSITNVQAPTLEVVAMSFLAAYTLFMALVSMYDALKRGDPATVLPIIGSVAAISSFGMSYLLLGTRLLPNFIWGIILLSVGTLLVAQTLPKRGVILNVIHSGLFFALHYISMKGLFNEVGDNFDNAFFWSRIGLVLFALSLLLVPAYWDKIFEETAKATRKTGVIVLGNKILAGIAAFMLLKAIDSGDVSVVQATDGLKFVFILLLSILFARWLPATCCGKDDRPSEQFRRILYVIIIMIGFIFLFASEQSWYEMVL